jgi:hypothetical protein
MIRLIIFLAIAMIIANETLKKNNRVFIVDSIIGGHRGAFIPPFGTFITNQYINNSSVIVHENCHYEQYKQQGLISFILNYVIQFLRFGYEKMPMESECRIGESEFCKQNYLLCYPKEK